MERVEVVKFEVERIRQIVVDALVGMIAGVTNTTPPTDQPLPGFVQAPVDRAVEKISAAVRDEVEALLVWRTLALQFDRHRMTALAHLKAVVESPNATNIQACQEFLGAAPVPGQVVEQLIAADAIERIVHYVVSKRDQDVLRRIVLEKRREAGLEAAMAAKEGV